MFDDQAIQRLGSVQRKRGTKLAIEQAQRSHAVDYNTAVGLALEYLGAARGLRREFSDDLLEDVLERYQAEQFAVLVNHKPEPLARGLELLQLRKQRSTSRNEIG